MICIMKNMKLLAALALTATAVSAAAYFIRKKQKEKKSNFVANAGYEFAYDIHYPVRYKR